MRELLGGTGCQDQQLKDRFFVAQFIPVSVVDGSSARFAEAALTFAEGPAAANADS